MNVESSAIVALATESAAANRRSRWRTCASQTLAINEAGSSARPRAIRSCAARKSPSRLASNPYQPQVEATVESSATARRKLASACRSSPSRE